MTKHEFLTYQEAVDQLGASETLRQAILTWDLPVYIEFNEVIADRCEADVLPDSNGTKFASWKRASRQICVADPDIEYPSQDDYEEEVYYTLSGWFMMRPPDACVIARSPNRDIGLKLYMAPAQDEDDGHLGFFTPEHFEVNYSTRLEQLWFRRPSVARLAAGEPIEGTADDAHQDNLIASNEQVGGNAASNVSKVHERRALTYMPIIRALQKMAKVSRPEDAQRVMEKLGTLGYHHIDAEMIERVLCAARGFTLKLYDSARDKKPNPYTFDRSTFLPIIHSLSVLANLPDDAAAPSVDCQLQQLGFNGPKDTTIRGILAEARGFVPRPNG